MQCRRKPPSLRRLARKSASIFAEKIKKNRKNSENPLGKEVHIDCFLELVVLTRSRPRGQRKRRQSPNCFSPAQVWCFFNQGTTFCGVPSSKNLHFGRMIPIFPARLSTRVKKIEAERCLLSILFCEAARPGRSQNNGLHSLFLSRLSLSRFTHRITWYYLHFLYVNQNFVDFFKPLQQ